MSRFLYLGFIIILLLISSAGVCLAEGAHNYQVYLQGGESVISNGTNDLVVIIIKDAVRISI